MKKGISPLVATVLLIGFVIVIAVTVWFWYRGIVEEQAQKTGTTTTTKGITPGILHYSLANAL